MPGPGPAAVLLGLALAVPPDAPPQQAGRPLWRVAYPGTLVGVAGPVAVFEHYERALVTFDVASGQKRATLGRWRSQHKGAAEAARGAPDAPGIAVVAGDRPRLGDLKRKEDLSAYRRVGKALAPLRTPTFVAFIDDKMASPTTNARMRGCVTSTNSFARLGPAVPVR